MGIARPPDPQPVARTPGVGLVIAAGIGMAGGLLSLLPTSQSHLAVLWLPNAFLVALLVIRPDLKPVPIILVGCLATALANMARGEMLLPALLMAAANIASVGVNLAVLRRLFPHGPSFARPSYILRIALAALFGGVVSALIGAPTIAYYHDEALLTQFGRWLVSDGLAMMLFVPLIVQIADYRAAPPTERPRLFTVVWVTALVLAVAVAVFSVGAGPTLYLLPPAVVVATLVLGPLGAALAVAASAAVALPLTHMGYGPAAFLYDSWPRQLQFLELYCVVLILSSAPVAGSLAHIRRISRDLEASREQFSSLVDNLGEVIFRTDLKGRMTLLNPAWERLTGYGVEASYGRSFLRFVAANDRAAVREALWPLFAGRAGQCRVELRCRRRDGAIRWCEVTAENERSPDGALLGAAGAIRDITARKVSEIALADSEQRFRTIAEYVTDVILKTDADTVCYYASPSIREALGYRPENIVGRPLAGLIHPDDVEGRRLIRETILRNPGRDTTHRMRVRRQDGSWLWMEAKSRLIDIEPDGPRVLSVLRDVERHQRLEAALVAARDAAEATARTRSDFLAMISHEIRTPMTGILGMIGLLRDTRSAAERGRFIEALEGSSRTLMRMLDDVLDVAKLEAGAVRVEAAPFDLRAMVREVVSLFQSGAAARGVAIVTLFDGPEPAGVIGDSTRIRQVLGNLVGNAVKFTAEGQIEVRVQWAPGDRWKFAVRDQGIGIPKAALDTIFEPFAQANAAISGRFGGTGLGLTIARRLVEALGGTLSAESEVGAGSCFRFTLTLPATGEIPIPADVVPLEPLHERPLSLLVAEDNPVNRLLIATLLKRMGHRAVTVDDGHAALTAARQGGYDAVLMDLQMPLMDGIEAALAIRQMPGTRGAVPIIAITADPQVEALDGFAEAGFQAIIGKPIDRARLAETLAKIARFSIEPPDIDRVALAEAAALVGNDGMRRLLELFLADGAGRAGVLKAALAADDLETLRREAHALAGGASAACARRLEASARRTMRADSTLADAEALIAALNSAAAAVRAAMDEHHPATAAR